MYFQMRGALCFVVAVISLLLFDHDEMLDHMGHAGDHEDILFTQCNESKCWNTLPSKITL